MSFIKAKRGYGLNLHNKQIGRPKGSGNLKLPDYKSTIPAKLSPALVEMIEVERRNNESYSDTILRLIRHANHQRNEAIKKYDALLERHNKLELIANNLSQ